MKPRKPGGPQQRMEFLYEDRDIIVVDKPAGLPVIAPEGSRMRTAYDLVTERIRARNPKGRAAVVHRLDRDTSGVMVFAVHAGAKRSLMSAWDESVTLRRYVAVVEGSAETESGVLDCWLKENSGGTVYRAAAGEHGALRAITRWTLRAQGSGYALLDLDLETGRKHQIRAQFADAGVPVAGDARYGAATDPLGRLCLHATVLELRHPGSGKVMRFESPAPHAFPGLVRGARGPA